MSFTDLYLTTKEYIGQPLSGQTCRRSVTDVEFGCKKAEGAGTPGYCPWVLTGSTGLGWEGPSLLNDLKEMAYVLPQDKP